MNILNLKKIDLNQLPTYSNWPEKLLNSKPEVMYFKNSENIFREYELDKWGSLLRDAEKNNLGLNEVDSKQFEDADKIVISHYENLYLLDPLEARSQLSSIFVSEISKFFTGNESIVELGAGSGSLLLRMAEDSRLKGATYYARDFSPSSLKLINYLAKSKGLIIDTGLCDFFDMKSLVGIPAGSIICISFALALVKGLKSDFWRLLASLNPKAIIIGEPIYQQFGSQSLLSLMRKRYYDLNDYSKDILPSLLHAEKEGFIQISSVDENVLGINPLCPISLIVLKALS